LHNGIDAGYFLPNKEATFRTLNGAVLTTKDKVPSWSMLEAMSTGCLVVGSKTSSVEEVIKDNYNGLLVDFFNINELADKVEYVLNNQEELTYIV